MNDFLELIRFRLESIVKEAGNRTPSVLLSGGSTSTFLLRAWARFLPSTMTRRAIYLQFDHFNWLERENARLAASECGFDLVEIQLSEKPLLSLLNRGEFDRDQFWSLALSEARVQAEGPLLSGFGWPELFCDRETATGRCHLREHVFHRSRGKDDCLDFFDPLKKNEWRAFRTDPQVQLFESLIDEIPFSSIRYWQDFVFQKHISTFQPCPAWKIEECLGLV